jgi:hypothetical protein
MNSGYFPGIATTGKHIVYLENMDGDAEKFLPLHRKKCV